jgi:deoxyribodipyrimidine photo-lyase
MDRGGAIVPVFVHAPGEEAPWSPGGAPRCWLHQPLAARKSALAAFAKIKAQKNQRTMHM